MYTNLAIIGGFKGGGAVHYHPLSEIRGGCTPLDFYKVISPKAFDLEQVIYDHRQIVQAGKNGDTPKVDCLNVGQQCLKCLYF